MESSFRTNAARTKAVTRNYGRTNVIGAYDVRTNNVITNAVKANAIKIYLVRIKFIRAIVRTTFLLYPMCSEHVYLHTSLEQMSYRANVFRTNVTGPFFQHTNRLFC